MKFSTIFSHIADQDPTTPAIIIGKPGIGKTQAVKAFGKVQGFDDDSFVALNCAQFADEGDMIGLLQIKDGQHSHTIPDWLKLDRKMLIFVDELNRAPKSCINGLMQLMSPEQTFNGHKLFPGSRVIAAINPADVAANDCDELNRALFSRFARYNAEVCVDEWVSWAHDAKIDDMIIDFIIKNGKSTLINMDESQTAEDENTVNPRSVVNFALAFARAKENGRYEGPDGLEYLYEGAMSMLGSRWALNFKDWYSKNGNTITAKTVFETPEDKLDTLKKAFKKLRPTDFCAINAGIVDMLNLSWKNTKKITDEQASRFLWYFFAVNREIRTKLYVDFIKTNLEGGDPTWIKTVSHDATLGKKFKTEIRSIIDNEMNTEDEMMG